MGYNVYEVIVLDNLFWKDEAHKEDYEKILAKFEREYFDSCYNSFAYLVSATGKTDEILNYLSPMGVSGSEIKEMLENSGYSKSERNLILFALQLFSSTMSDIPFHDVVSSLDSYNYKCVYQAIQMRYGKPE